VPQRLAARCAGVGVALNPITPLEALESVRGRIAVVDLLTTEPDLAGEQLLPGSVARVRRLRELLPRGRIQVDGGVSEESAAALVRAGADELVVGRAITAAEDWHAAVERLRQALR
jgi:ribulose-phosphate 3-epimerase